MLSRYDAHAGATLRRCSRRSVARVLENCPRGGSEGGGPTCRVAWRSQALGWCGRGPALHTEVDAQRDWLEGHIAGSPGSHHQPWCHHRRERRLPLLVRRSGAQVLGPNVDTTGQPAMDTLRAEDSQVFVAGPTRLASYFCGMQP